MNSKIEDDKIYTGKSLSEEMNKERADRGEGKIPEINPCKGSTNTLARKDKSWNSVLDFFVKAFKKQRNI